MKSGKAFLCGRVSRSAVSIHAFSAVLTVLLSCSAQANGTLDKVAKSGVLTMGYQLSPPFSYVDENQHPIGYTVDICAKIIEVVKREIKRPDLVVKYKQVNTDSRFPALIDGDIDMECGNTTNTAERRKKVAFTIPTFIAATRLLVRTDSGIKSINNLAGKTVVADKGSSGDKIFSDLNATRTLRATLVYSDGSDKSFAMVESGKADAYITDDILLYTLRANAKDPEKFEVTRDALTIEPLSIMLRKDDPSFKKLVDTEVTRIILQGEIYPIYRKWFESPIPPKQLNLKLPMVFMLRDSFKTPTDWVPNQ
jgi:ABC-type amino acid transport substrate-binding protein